MKNWSIFAVSRQKTIIALLSAEIFISTLIEHRVLGLPIPNGFCTVRSEIVFAEIGDSAALFLYPYFNFSYMAKTMKNCGTANHSTRTSTSAHDTSESFYSKFLTEKRAKNQAYGYILSRGLLRDYIAYSRGESCSLESIDERVELILKNC